ncbi:hypothetical protein JL720_2783 [Aureococcus anophagefferens]|nr:hypothetical protein JL720_2783 [Aureococcus anophagefferens]
MDLEVDSLGDAPSLEWKKSARRRSSTGSRKVPRRSVLSESTNRHNNAADDAEADSDGDLCHKTDPERGETWFARWGELVGVLRAIGDGVAPDVQRARRELLRCGVEIVDAADAEDAAGRDALVLRFSLPPAMVAAARARDALDRGAQQVCVWTAPTQALVADKVDDLQGRYGEGWRNAGGRGDFAAASPAWSAAARGGDDGVVFDYADAAASSSTSASTARHPVLAAISAKACDVAVLVMCPRCSRARGRVRARGAGIMPSWSSTSATRRSATTTRSGGARRRRGARSRPVGRREGAVVALSGTLSKFEVGSLLEALGLPPAPATLVIRTASPINSMVDIHTGGGGGDRTATARPARAPGPRGREPAGAGHAAARGHRLPARARARAAPPAALATRRAARRAGSDAHLAKALGMAQEGPEALLVAASAAISDATAPAAPAPGDEADRRRCAPEILLRRQKSALVAERDGAAAELAHLCQEKVRVLKSSTAKMQDLKATIKQYYLTVTFTTVGYGDWTPKTDAGKGFAMAYARAAGFSADQPATRLSGRLTAKDLGACGRAASPSVWKPDFNVAVEPPPLDEEAKAAEPAATAGPRGRELGDERRAVALALGVRPARRRGA